MAVLPLRHFSPLEFRCKCGCGAGMEKMDADLLQMLDEARDLAGIPFPLSSAYRCPKHNKAVGGVPTSSHTRGYAVDIRCVDSHSRFVMLQALLEAGFRRIELAPTWIHVADTNGNISSIASAAYVSYAHKQNVEVWMTVRDFDGGISSEKESYELLSYTSRRETLITQLIAEALRVSVDGINVDFEKISDKCGEHYIEFIRELSVKCRQNGLVLSVDNYVPKSFNTQYDRKEQGIVADYVVIMGYDEYYAGSPEAGPVSSYNYVKEGITETLKEVPAEKVISGIPFFTRLWKETPKTEEELKSDKGTDAEQYSATVESDAYGMDNAQAVVKQAGVDTTWDKKAGQNYATWEADGSKYEIWLEDSKSIEAKLKLMKKYKLAGTAEWSLGQESSDIWNLIQKYVN